MFGFLICSILGLIVGAFVAITFFMVGMGPLSLLVCPIMALLGGIFGYIMEAGLMS